MPVGKVTTEPTRGDKEKLVPSQSTGVEEADPAGHEIDEEEYTEAEILEEMSIEILRRRLNATVRRLGKREREKKLAKQEEAVVDQQRLIEE